MMTSIPHAQLEFLISVVICRCFHFFEAYLATSFRSYNLFNDKEFFYKVNPYPITIATKNTVSVYISGKGTQR
jgi:hypothetical protein